MFAEWEDGERFSFEDSDRFEEDSLCSFISEAESLCQNWRGWRKQSAGPNSPTGGGGGGGSGGTRMRGESKRRGKGAGWLCSGLAGELSVLGSCPGPRAVPSSERTSGLAFPVFLGLASPHQGVCARECARICVFWSGGWEILGWIGLATESRSFVIHLP